MRRSELLKLAKPILFNTEMVIAIMEGRKTVTRRLIKNYRGAEDVRPRMQNDNEQGIWYIKDYNFHTCWHKLEYYIEGFSKYQVGDILYVRETWSTHYTADSEELVPCYRADSIDFKSECLPGENNRWHPSIHMPKKYARTFLRITDIKVERLNDITISGIYHEGAISQYICEHPNLQDMYNGFAYTVWGILWNRTIQKEKLNLYGWDANPYVFVYEFEKVEVNDG
ncbi:MAG: hypothetical protein RR738_04760 [Anaerorhabdus sp.]|uniref:hypothetical protein n=1 Tax=Anaerorhabdus sp. TaxID=1872524 RepID=UPI002FC99A13